MRREKRRNLRISAQFAVHLLGHIDKAVHRPQEIAVERLVSHMAFMRFDVVDLTKDTRRTVLLAKRAIVPKQGAIKGVQYFISTKSGFSRAIHRPTAIQLNGFIVFTHRTMYRSGGGGVCTV